MIKNKDRIKETINKWLSERGNVKAVVVCSLDGLPQVTFIRDGHELDAEKLSAVCATFISLSNAISKEFFASEYLKKIKVEFEGMKLSITPIGENEGLILIEEV